MMMGSKPASVEDVDRVQGGARHAAHGAARRHGADVDAGVEAEVRHADAVAEDGAAGERARRVDGDDADFRAAVADQPGEVGDERRLAAAGHAGDADHMRVPGAPVDLGERLAGIPARPDSAREIIRPTAAGWPASMRSISDSDGA
jgi:hypothetical protein